MTKEPVAVTAESTDEELAFALQSGEVRAFEFLARRHQGRVYAVAYRITTNREDALDVAQEVFLKAYTRIDAWKPTGHFLPWLLRLAVNQAIDHLRRQKRKREEPLELASRPDVAFASDHATRSPEHEARASEIGRRTREALNVLSPTQRSVFVLRHYEGLPLADIAAALGCTIGSVKVHLFRALKKMQHELSDLL